jgi:tetratricopeptide (TPR) repeat protein
MPTGLAVAALCRSSPPAWIAVMLLLAFTRLGQIVPWTSFADPVSDHNPAALATFHVPPAFKDRVLKAHVPYVRSLLRPDHGVIAGLSEFLRANAAADDVVVTNFGWEALYFHTGLRQGARLSPRFPISRAARAAGVPDYVFETKGARWLVCRRAWPAYFAEQDCRRVLQEAIDAGLSVRLVRSIRETGYENRENIHFRRFAGNTHVFPSYGRLPDALVYRIETFAESVVHYRREVDRDPHDRNALGKLGLALVATGAMEEAIAVFRLAVTAAPLDSGAHRDLANALADHGQAAEAATHAQEAVSLRPDDPGAHDVLGRAFALQGRLLEAAEHFERAIEVDPAYADAREHLVRVRDAMMR